MCWFIKGAWRAAEGCSRATRLILPPEILTSEWSQLLCFEIQAWPASQHLQVLCFFKSLMPSWTFCSPAGTALAAAVWSWGRLQPAALPNALMDTCCSWSFLDLLYMHLLPAWTYWPGHCLVLGILKPLLNWLFAFGSRDNSCLWEVLPLPILIKYLYVDSNKRTHLSARKLAKWG